MRRFEDFACTDNDSVLYYLASLGHAELGINKLNKSEHGLPQDYMEHQAFMLVFPLWFCTEETD
jgi:hypothetical protein